MKRYWMVALGIAVAILMLFLLAQATEVRILNDPGVWMEHGGAAAAVVGVGLLIADVLLPVPSSGVMIAHGALFGLWAGMLLSLVGSVGAALVAFGIGRSGGPWMARFVSPEEQQRADRLLERWGAVAIVATRPVPILAETVVILAGASSMGWARAAGAALVGSLPPAALYALAGAMAVSWGGGSLVFVGVLLLSAVFLLLARRVAPRASPQPTLEVLRADNPQ